MKIAYFDCFSGVSGDMALGALLACDLALEAQLRDQLLMLGVGGWNLDVGVVSQQGISAIKVDVRLEQPESGHGRKLGDILGIVDDSGLSSRIIERSTAVFGRLADAEAKIHGIEASQVHFHEVGAVDAIIDIVGTAILLEALGIDRLLVSSLPCGFGEIHCRHGHLPSPAPATVELLRGFDVHPLEIEAELVTPTGAAIVTALGASSRALPPMRVQLAGFGAGSRKLPGGRPNILRVVVGETTSEASTPAVPWQTDTVAIIETNVDDQSPQELELLMERCLESGAHDVFFTPIVMKRSRPAVSITVMCAPDKLGAIAQLVFTHSTTFGMRVREQTRFILERSWQTVSTEFGLIRVKLGRLGDNVVTASPEYSDCKAAALQHDVPLHTVHQSALMHYAVDPLTPSPE